MSGSLANSPSDVMRTALIQLSLGTNPPANQAWPIYASGEPSSPDNCITVYDTAGKVGGRHNTDGTTLEHPGIQIRVRASNFRTGWTKANSVSIALDSVFNLSVVVSGTTYEVASVTRTGNILHLGNEGAASKRQIFTSNVVIALRQIS
jgi:hypothetical protein